MSKNMNVLRLHWLQLRWFEMIKNFLFTACVYLHFNFTQCLHTKNSIWIQRDLGKTHTQKSKWKETAQFIEKRVDDIIPSSLWSSQLRETSRNIAAKTKMTYSLLDWNKVLKQVNRYIFSPGVHYQGQSLHVYFGRAFNMIENQGKSSSGWTKRDVLATKVDPNFAPATALKPPPTRFLYWCY